jgi:hypothetical protein
LAEAGGDIVLCMTKLNLSACPKASAHDCGSRGK